MFLSIVIPVYKAARWLPGCLQSIWDQGLPEDDFEVVCVDDCSPDDSLQVLERERQGHPNLRVLRNAENLRAGGSRNHGVREARGEYVFFIDADDYFHPGSLLWAYHYQKEHGLDILVGDMSRESYGGAVSEKFVLNYPYHGVCSGREFLLKNGLPGGPTKYFFRRSLMTENGVWFAEKVACEDPDWAWKLPYYARRMQYQPVLFHHYVLYPDSSTGGEFKSSKATLDRLRCARRLWDLSVLYDRQEERKALAGIAGVTFKVGVLFLCALSTSPAEKAAVLHQTAPEDMPVRGLVRFAFRHPLCYAWASTLVSPLFRLAVRLKRRLKGR